MTIEGDRDLLRFSTAGSVDDGKSTLIGRLLVDGRGVYEDQMAAATAENERRGNRGVDLAAITDGLQAEREQGITIDVAYRYFTTARRKYIIADTPGHEQYTRNMVTGASTADAAVILLDARKGPTPQSRRHAFIAHLLGVPSLVVAVNKMDLVGFDRAVFERIRSEFGAFCDRLGAATPRFVPLSALHGDMVVHRGERLGWYSGPTLIEMLESLPVARSLTAQPFRFPVQMVARPGPESDYRRGYMGRIEGGRVAIGDEISVLPSGLGSRVADIRLGERQLESAVAPQSVVLYLEDEIDIGRGDLLCQSTQAPRVERQLEAMVCWMDTRAAEPGRRYLLKRAGGHTRGRLAELVERIDVTSLAVEPAPATLGLNQVGRVRIDLQQPQPFDCYGDQRATGSFILVDPDSHFTAGAGMVIGSGSVRG
jgi:sulfate adenylyltransferase subunit 1